MTTTKETLIHDLTTAHETMRKQLVDLPPDRVIHSESGWTVKDIVGHLAVWYGERINAVSAYRQGDDYQIANFDMDTFNHRTVEERRDRPFEAIRAEWEQAHSDLLALLESLPPEAYADQMMFPWGSRGPVSLFIERLVEHIQEHSDDFRQAGG